MNNLKIFENEKFGEIRTIIDENNEPWLVGKDIAEILEYASPANAIKKHIEDEDKGVTELMTPGGKQKMTICVLLLFFLKFFNIPPVSIISPF